MASSVQRFRDIRGHSPTDARRSLADATIRDVDRQRDEWDEIARLDPLWAILSDPAKRHGRWQLDAFFATGRDEIEGVLALGAGWNLPAEHREALDFGCGVGRLTRAMASYFGGVVGVDLSGVMIERARLLHADEPRCSFAELARHGRIEFPDARFNFVYSRIVLQHIADRRVTAAFLREFVRVLAPGGLLVFQVPSSIPIRRQIQARPMLYGALRSVRVPPQVLYRRLGLHPIRMRAMPESFVTELLTDAGAELLRVDRAIVGPAGFDDRTYWATRSR